ncbi:DUF817 domain-containing protein [Methylobacterium sp. JK268]
MLNDPAGPASAARLWAPLARFIALDARIGARAEASGPVAVALYEFVRFGLKQGWACLFGGALCGLMLAFAVAYPAHAPLARYDALTLAAVAIQAGMLALRLETWEEARVILVFHLVGTAMELFKTAAGSWIYPEPSLLRIGGVPLFTGFLYASVGSYLARVWRLFDLRFTRHPPLPCLVALATTIYVNFFTHHVLPDLRLGLFAVAALLFGPTTVHYKIRRVHRRMPLLLGLALVALFIWFAENIGTLSRTWIYPHQREGWSAVPIAKLGAWFLLMIISYTLVAVLNRPRPVPIAPAAPSDRPAH